MQWTAFVGPVPAATGAPPVDIVDAHRSEERTFKWARAAVCAWSLLLLVELSVFTTQAKRLRRDLDRLFHQIQTARPGRPSPLPDFNGFQRLSIALEVASSWSDALDSRRSITSRSVPIWIAQSTPQYERAAIFLPLPFAAVACASGRVTDSNAAAMTTLTAILRFWNDVHRDPARALSQRATIRKAETVPTECESYPSPVNVGYGASKRRQKAAEVLLPIAGVGNDKLADWRRLTHDGYRFNPRCAQCGDVITLTERTELEALHILYRQHER